MATRVDPELKKDLMKFGGEQWNECFHCGDCTAACALTEEEMEFPRKPIRLMQIGLKDKLVTCLEPWICYYCGTCTEQCPRDANPGEMMMVMRRYLTSVYDWTGLSRKFYTSKIWELNFVLVVAVLVALAFWIVFPPAELLFSNPDMYINQQGGVMINHLIKGLSPRQFVRHIEILDWSMAFVVASLLISNIFHMFYLVVWKGQKGRIPIYAYFKEFWNLIWHFSTQPKFSRCEDKRYWAGHWLLMSGYTIMFVLIVVALPVFQIEEIKAWYHWQRILGYYATFGILSFLVYVTITRFRRRDLKAQYTHASDWLFIIMLGATTLTGILLHVFRISGCPIATYFAYLIHMMVLVPMILIEVPFSKWSHLAYRPFAIYFFRLKKYRKKG